MNATSLYRTARTRFVGLVYADHNRRKVVRTTVAEAIASLPKSAAGLNLGAGETEFDTRMVNFDVFLAPHIAVAGNAVELPFNAEAFDLVVTQEVLEHVQQPFAALREVARVLAPGGTLYLQVPFIIGYHPGPTDYWRFTVEGIRELVEQAGLDCNVPEVAVGSSSGFYRITVEYLAILFSLPLSALYTPMKALFSALLYPIKLLDPLTDRSPQVDRVAGGYFVVATKPV